MNPGNGGKGTKKDILLNLLCAGSIMVPAILFSLKSDLPHVALLCALVLGFSLLKRHAIALGDRPIIYFTVLSLVLASFLDMAIPMNDARGGILDILVKSSLTAPALLYMACFATLLEQKPLTLGIILSLSISALLVGGDMLRDSIPPSPERLAFASIKELTAHFRLLYLSCVVLETLFIICALQRQRLYTRLDVSSPALWTRRAVRMALLALLPFLAVAGTRAFYSNETLLRKVEMYFSSSSFMRRPFQSQLPFSSEPDLTKGLPKEDPRRAAMIIARVKAAYAPGLLRARGFSTYEAGRWTASSLKEQLHGLRQSDAITSSVFILPGEADLASLKKMKRLEIFQSRYFSSDMLLVPANVKAVEIATEKLAVSPDGLFNPSEWKTDTGFTAFVPSIAQFSGYSEPGGTEIPKEYLAVPEALKPALADLAAEASAIAAGSKFKGDAALANGIASALRSHCKYTLETKDTPAGVDPVENFLLRTHEGHCELFASAAALALRSMGVPARYATGLVCDETHPSGSYFVARLGGMHAWCEAFLRDEAGAGRWVAVDPTPASDFERFRPKWGVADSISDWISHSLRQVMAWLQRGYFASAVFELVGDLAFGFWFFASSAFGVVLEILLAIGAIVYLLRRRAQALRLRAETPLAFLLLQRQFRRLEKAAASRSGLRRKTGMTLEEWAILAKESCGEGLFDLVRDYEALRYRQSPPSPEDLAAFSAKAEAFLKELRKRR